MEPHQSTTRLQDFRGRGWRERALFKRLDRLHTGRLRVALPDERTFEFAGRRSGPNATLTFASLNAVTRLFLAGSIGFAEGYMAGEWDCDHLPELIYLLHLNGDALAPDYARAGWIAAALALFQRAAPANHRRGARRNAAYHYDLGNDFYAQWLDATWTYSSALFAARDEPLEIAQKRKYARLLERLAPAPGDHILEIGCGWGGFARYAATHAGVRVTGLTLSQEQLSLARDKTTAAGLDEHVELALCDYRDVEGVYDHVVSIEMYEAVGEAFWSTYFSVIADALKPGGRAALQAITIDAERFEDYRRRIDFIQKYIFPGGMLASPAVFAERAAAAGLAERERAFYGDDYARTLMCWDQSVRAAQPSIEANRSPTFYRMWRYYLAYCAAGFTSGNIDLMQIVFDKPSG